MEGQRGRATGPGPWRLDGLNAVGSRPARRAQPGRVQALAPGDGVEGGPDLVVAERHGAPRESRRRVQEFPPI